MPRYEVTIILDPVEIEADSPDEAEEIAADLIGADAWTRLHEGLVIAGFDTVEMEDDDE